MERPELVMRYRSNGGGGGALENPQLQLQSGLGLLSKCDITALYQDGQDATQQNIRFS